MINLMKEQTSNLSGHSPWNENKLVIGIILVGIFLRVYHFLDNRSLWGDEIMLALNIVDYNYWQLALPLRMEQYAPLGFLWIEKSMNLMLGDGERALRLFPLFCGIVSLILFYKLSKHILNKTERVIALTLLAFAHPAIYYSVEVKQYQTEMMVAILLYLSYYQYFNKINFNSMLTWGLLGALALWFSYSAVFILASFSIVLLLEKFIKKNYPDIFVTAIACSIWALSFLINYFLFIKRGSSSNYLISYWANNFFPVQLNITWYFKTILHLFDNPLGINLQLPLVYDKLFRFSVFGFLLLIVGIVYFIKQQNKHIALLIPALLIAVVSAFQKYPIFERFLLFYSPILFILIAKGAGRIQYILENKQYKYVYSILLLLLLLPTVSNSIYQLLNRDFFGLNKRRESKEVFAYINTKSQASDSVYIHWKLEIPLEYYDKLNNYKFVPVYGTDVNSFASDINSYTTLYTSDIEKLIGKDSVWLAVSSIKNVDENYFSPPRIVSEAAFLKDIADKYGVLIHQKKFLDTEVYLYNFSATRKSK